MDGRDRRLDDLSGCLWRTEGTGPSGSGRVVSCPPTARFFRKKQRRHMASAACITQTNSWRLCRIVARKTRISTDASRRCHQYARAAWAWARDRYRSSCRTQLSKKNTSSSVSELAAATKSKKDWPGSRGHGFSGTSSLIPAFLPLGTVKGRIRRGETISQGLYASTKPSTRSKRSV